MGIAKFYFISPEYHRTEKKIPVKDDYGTEAEALTYEDDRRDTLPSWIEENALHMEMRGKGTLGERIADGYQMFGKGEKGDVNIFIVHREDESKEGYKRVVEVSAMPENRGILIELKNALLERGYFQRQM